MPEELFLDICSDFLDVILIWRKRAGYLTPQDHFLEFEVLTWQTYTPYEELQEIETVNGMLEEPRLEHRDSFFKHLFPKDQYELAHVYIRNCVANYFGWRYPGLYYNTLLYNLTGFFEHNIENKSNKNDNIQAWDTQEKLNFTIGDLDARGGFLFVFLFLVYQRRKGNLLYLTSPSYNDVRSYAHHFSRQHPKLLLSQNLIYWWFHLRYYSFLEEDESFEDVFDCSVSDLYFDEPITYDSISLIPEIILFLFELVGLKSTEIYLRFKVYCTYKNIQYLNIKNNIYLKLFSPNIFSLYTLFCIYKKFIKLAVQLLLWVVVGLILWPITFCYMWYMDNLVLYDLLPPLTEEIFSPILNLVPTSWTKEIVAEEDIIYSENIIYLCFFWGNIYVIYGLRLFPRIGIKFVI